MPEVKTLTPAHAPTPIGPYSHIAQVGPFITIGGVGGVRRARCNTWSTSTSFCYA